MKLFTSLITVGAIAFSTASAAPWTGPAPQQLKPADETYAEGANQAQQNMAEGGFGLDPTAIDWAKDHVMIDMPVSNITVPALTQLLSGRYFIYASSANGQWGIRYHDPNGKTHFCQPVDGQYREWVHDRHIKGTSVGLGGIMYWDPVQRGAPKPPTGTWGWPLVANPDTGEIARYYLKGNSWETEIGWMQDAFPSEASVHCPRLPRSSSVNSTQSGVTLRDMAKSAKPVRGFARAFKNDPRAPLTAGEYYYLYPPNR